MMLEIVMVAGVAGHCTMEMAWAAAYRWQVRARVSLLTAIAALPEGAEVAEQAVDGSMWRASIAHRPDSEAA